MEMITREDFEANKAKFYERIKKGAVFIYPTDTIYGIGCDATNEEAVQKIRDIKNRKNAPFSVIAPSKDWIYQHCRVPPKGDDYIKKLPGPYTFIFTKKEICVAPSVTMDKESLGVRMPQNWFLDEVMHLSIPVVTTSANKRGNEHMTSIEDLDEEIKEQVDFIIYEGKKQGRPSMIINMSDNFKIIER